MTVETFINQALDLIGYQRPVGSIYEGTRAARIALDIYGQTRDELLVAQPWDFARKEIPLSPSGVVFPPQWTHSYLYPEEDVVKLLALRPTSIPVDPQPIRWTEMYNTNLSPPIRLIATNIEAAVGVFTARVLDFSLWPPDFSDLFVRSLAQKFSVLLPQQAGNENGSRRRSEQRPSAG